MDFGKIINFSELTGLDISVVAKHSMFNLSYMKVYLARGELICRAERIEKIHTFVELLGLKDY